MSDLPDFDALEDEAFPPLPPPFSPGEGGALTQGDPFGDGEEGEVSKLADVPAAKRKAVKRPRPKLDSQRLISARGLPALRTLFDDVHFKGKGHEAEDLRLLMQRMENWAHRLFPKLQFEDFIERVEKLGSKKEVQTCLKRIRLDMPLTDEDFMGQEGGEEPPPDTRGPQDPDPFGSQTSFNAPQALIHSTPAPAAAAPVAPPSLSEEQRRRMELNRQRALQRRLARRQTDSQEVTAPSSGNDLSGSAELEQLEDSDLDPSSSTQPPEPPQAEAESSRSLDLPDLSGSAGQEKPGEHLDLDPSSSTQPPPSAPPEVLAEPPAESSQGDQQLHVLPSSAEQKENLEDPDLSSCTHPPAEPDPPAEDPKELPAEDEEGGSLGSELPPRNICEEEKDP